MGIVRKEGWDTLLAEKVRELSHIELDWDTYNCAHFTCEVLESFTETNFRELTAAEELTSEVCIPMWKEARLIPSVDERLGILHNDNMLQCSRGDLVCHDGKALGVSMGALAVFMSHDKGVEYLPIDTCKCFWRI